MASLVSALSVAFLMPRSPRAPTRRLAVARQLGIPTACLLGIPAAPPPRRKLLINEATPADWTDVVGTLEPFARVSRVQRLTDVLSKRRAGLHLVLENIADPFNGQ